MANVAIALLRRLGGDTLVRDVVRAFLATAPAKLEELRTGVQHRDLAAIERAAHALKASSGQLGGTELQGACEELERLAVEREVNALLPQFDALAGAYDRFAARVTKLLDGATVAARPRIAVVEDNEDNRLLISAILRDRFDLDEYGSGLDALVGIRLRVPDLLLLDISLPLMDGLEVLARLRADEATRALPVVAVTAHAMAGDREKYLAAGFDEYVSKPIMEERTLLEPVTRLLGERARAEAAA